MRVRADAGRPPPARPPGAVAGNDIVLLLDDPTHIDVDALTAALDRPQPPVWSPVFITMQELRSFENLHMWLSSQPRPFGALAVDGEATKGLLDPQDRFTCPTLLSDASVAYLAMRKVDDDRWQFGAHGFGPDADALTSDMIDLLVRWDHAYRHAPSSGSPSTRSARPHRKRNSCNSS